MHITRREKEREREREKGKKLIKISLLFPDRYSMADDWLIERSKFISPLILEASVLFPF